MSRSNYAMLSLVLLLAGCGSGAAPSAAEREKEMARVAGALQRYAHSGNPGNVACGTRPSAHPRILLSLDASTCMSCRSVAHLLREASDSLGVDNIVILVPAADTSELCRFAHIERIHSPIVVAARNTQLNTDVSRDGVYIELANGEVVRRGRIDAKITSILRRDSTSPTLEVQ